MGAGSKGNRRYAVASWHALENRCGVRTLAMRIFRVFNESTRTLAYKGLWNAGIPKKRKVVDLTDFAYRLHVQDAFCIWMRSAYALTLLTRLSKLCLRNIRVFFRTSIFRNLLRGSLRRLWQILLAEAKAKTAKQEGRIILVGRSFMSPEHYRIADIGTFLEPDVITKQML